MRQKIKRPVKVLTATADTINFESARRLSTEARTRQLLALLNLDAEIYKFQAAMRTADRLQRNKFIQP